MVDVTAHEILRNPCPNCGAMETIESLTDELRAVRKRVIELDEKSGKGPLVGTHFSNQVLVMRGNGTYGWQDLEPSLRFTFEICAACGLTYHPHIKYRADELRKDIHEAMKLIPLDLVAEAAQEKKA